MHSVYCSPKIQVAEGSVRPADAGETTPYFRVYHRGKTTVDNCIGGHVNVLSDYKKT